MTIPAIVGIVLYLVLTAVLLAAWTVEAHRNDQTDEDITAIGQHIEHLHDAVDDLRNPPTEPAPDTVPMARAWDIALRDEIPRPTPHPRTHGRHRA